MTTGGSAFELLAGEAAAGRPADGPVRPAGPEALRGRVGRLAALPRLRLLRELETGARGLEESEADARALLYGENRLSQPDLPGRWRRGRAALADPFALLLVAIAAVAALNGSLVGALVVLAGAATSCGLRIQQERRGKRAAAALRAMVSATTTVVRRAGPNADPVAREIPVAGLVPGDLVRLAPGDLVPADLYLLAAAELEVSEWVLTGESRPAAKVAAPAVLPSPAAEASSTATLDTHVMPVASVASAGSVTTATPVAAMASSTLPSSGALSGTVAVAPDVAVAVAPPAAVPWLCLAGGTVAHGTGTGVVITTGSATTFGAAHAAPPERRAAGGFDRAARRVTWLLMAFTVATVPLVLTLASARGLSEPAIAFALAVAVGLTPEMLPVVITTVLARAARRLAADGTVVRRLPAVHDLAAMNTLCIDKTGTLTEGRLAVTGSVDAAGNPAQAALDWAVTISSAVAARAPGLTDVFDEALFEAQAEAGADLAHDPAYPSPAASAKPTLAPSNASVADAATHLVIPFAPAPSGRVSVTATADGSTPTRDAGTDVDTDADLDLDPDATSGLARVIPFASAARLAAQVRAAAAAPAATPDSDSDLQVLDVLPFDPVRRRVSALLRDPSRLGSVILVTRGAVAEVLDSCATAQFAGRPTVPLTSDDRARLLDYAQSRAALGDRLIAVAAGDLPPRRAHTPLCPSDEAGLTLVGFVALRDRPAAASAAAVADLSGLGVRVAVLTGDAPEVAARICREIGLDPGRIATGAQIDACDGAQLAELAARTVVFARVDPAHKARVVAALRADGSVVGFLGDGVNDAPALRAADVGISVRGGAELARECADVVLGHKDLACLGRAVGDSRRAVANAVKYLRITISSNLGNALSVSLAVLILPFLPMLPLQVLVQNLCFDLCQLALARDRVDPDSAARPSRLSARDPAVFALVFGLLNTAADLATFAVLHRLTGGDTGPAAQSGRAAFYAGWFAENLLTQALAIFLLRTRRLSWPARPARAVTAAGLLLAGLGLALPVSRAGSLISFAKPPAAFYPYLAVIAAGYVLAVVLAKAGCRKLWPAWR